MKIINKTSSGKHWKLSEETKKKMSLAQKGKIISQETKDKLKKALTGRIVSKETREKISKTSKGRIGVWKGKKREPTSELVKEKIRASMLKRKEKFGYINSLETRLKMSKTRKGKSLGDKSHFWKGGISFEPYSIDWKETLRRSIRERDNYTCQICGKQQGDIAHDVHHIDYDKKNSNPNNLITLCHSCHAKTNSNREKWLELFKNSCKGCNL